MKRMRAFISVLLCAGILLTGCNTAQETENEKQSADNEALETPRETAGETAGEISGETTVAVVTAKPAKPELIVYVDNYSDITEMLVYQFRVSHPEVKVIAEEFPDMAILEFNAMIEEEMRAGGGPDVVFVNNSYSSTFRNTTQLVRDGLLLDVNSIGVDLDDCNATVLKAGQFEGGQYLVPTHYSLGLLYTTEDRMMASAFEYEEDMTLAEFASQMPEFYEKNPYTKIFPMYFTSNFLTSQNALDVIDYENNTIRTDAESLAKLEEMAKAYADLFPGIFSGDSISYMAYRNAEEYGGTVSGMYHGDALLFASGYTSSEAFGGATEALNMFNHIYYPVDVDEGETPIVLHLPTLDGEAPAPVMTYYLMVNANTQNRTAVKMFVEEMLSTEYQLDTLGCGIPVNNEAITVLEQFYGDPNSRLGEDYNLAKSCTFDEEFIETYFERIENMREPIWNDSAVFYRLNGVLRAYIADGLTMEEAVQANLGELETLIAEGESMADILAARQAEIEAMLAEMEKAGES